MSWLASPGSSSPSTAVFVLYTLWGGQLSVVRTDSWQLLLFGGSLLATLALVLRAGGSGRGGSLLFPGPSELSPFSRNFGWYRRWSSTR